ncbi:unnamed protein product [Clavelina lepadiformis]|uniref:Sema domain-containing protein n=1 Tax=Clavelina lepadiformis TaxID=159417 RepID=A0ABP0F3D7_CLALP
MLESGRFFRSITPCLLLTCFTLVLPSKTQKEESPYVKVSATDIETSRFSSSNASSYKSIRLHNDVLYIGGRGTLYRQNPGKISQQLYPPIEWKTSESKSTCLQLPQGNEENCDNYIQTIQPYNRTHMLLCGTMALSPKNIFLHIESGNLLEDGVVRTPLCSVDPMDGVTSLLASEGGEISSIVGTTRRQVRGFMNIVKNLPDASMLRTSNGEGKMIEESAKFVSSFIANDTMDGHVMKKLYFLFGEDTLELGSNSGSNSFGARIAQVCANDIGGELDSTKFTSFLKVSLICQTNDKNPYTFDVITSATLSDGILFGTFTTSSETFRNSAVCAFKLKDIQDALHSDSFWEKDKTSGNYKKVQNSHKDVGSAGTCSYPGYGGRPDASSKSFPSEFVDFVSSHPLVASPVTPSYLGSQPRTGSSYQHNGVLLARSGKFSKIAVNSFSAADGRTYNILFVGTETGDVMKVISLNKDSGMETILLAQYHLSEEEITDLVLSSEDNRLYVETKSQVMQIPTGNCEIYTKSCEFCDPCRMCVLARDPMCAWNPAINMCVFVDSEIDRSGLVQDVTAANPSICGTLAATVNLTAKLPPFGSSVILGKAVTSPSIHVSWFHLVDNNKQSISDSDEYHITSDWRLEIRSFQESDVGTYLSEYHVGDAMVGSETTVYSNGDDTKDHTVTITDDKTTTTTTDDKKSTPAVNNNSSINGTDGNDYTTPSPEYTGQPAILSGGAIAGFVFLVLLVALVVAALVFFLRSRRRLCFSSGKEKTYKPGENLKNHDATDAVSFAKDTNNSNNVNSKKHLNQSEEEEKLIGTRPDNPVTPPGLQKKKVAAVPPYRNDAVITRPNIPYIDDDVQMRKPPKRTKSIPPQDLRVKFGDDRVLKCNSIHRHKGRGTWFIEVDLPDDMEIDGEGVTSDLSNLGSDIFDKVSPRSPLTNLSSRSDEQDLRSAWGIEDLTVAQKAQFESGDTDSDSTLRASNSTLKQIDRGSGDSSLTSTPRQNVPLEVLQSSYKPNSHRKNKRRVEQQDPLSNPPHHPSEHLSSSMNPPPTILDSHLRRESARSDKSPTSTASSSSASSEKYHTAPPSPVRTV